MAWTVLLGSVGESGSGDLECFPQNTEYFGDFQNQVMVNFAVRDVQAMVDQLREMGRRRRQGRIQ